MNKYHEALNKLINNANIHLKEEYILLKELCDKQEAVKPYAYGDDCDLETGADIYDTAVCNCGKEFKIDYDEHCEYCPNCGQKLDWSYIEMLDEEYSD